jgi:hypothetical protein
VYFWLEIGDPDKTWENKPEEIRCNDPTISHPIASNQLIFLKYTLIALGIAFSSFLEIALISSGRIGIYRKTFIIPFLRWVACFLIGLVGGLIITRFNFNDSSRFVARNFLAVCQPHQLELLCNPDSQYRVDIVCTTPIHIWKPAVRSMLPQMMTVFFYVMLTSMFRVFFKWNWKEMWGWGLFLQGINTVWIVGVAVVCVHCNEVALAGVIFSLGLINVMAGTPAIIDLLFVMTDEFKEELPRYWNDVLPQNNIISQVYLPTTLSTPCGNQYPPPVMGPGSPPQKDNCTDTPPSMSIYPKLPTG